MAGFYLWNRMLTDREIAEEAKKCDVGMGGPVVRWHDFYDSVKKDRSLRTFVRTTSRCYLGEHPECQSDHYQALDQAYRAMGNADPGTRGCDQSVISAGWYRMMGNAGDQIPEECVPTGRCGTWAPGWLNGRHPTVEEGIVTREVCYHWNNKGCYWKNDIRVRNCGNYYVYELQPPPVCNLRYCGNQNALGPECYTYKKLSQADRAMSNTDQSNIKSDDKAPNALSFGWYRIMGKAGTQIPEECVPKNRCGTHATGWLESKHPTIDQDIVSGDVCFSWDNNCCRWRSSIRIRNCGDYYVYELPKPPTHSLRYCGNN